MEDAKHIAIPASLLGVALAIFVAFGFFYGGTATAGAVLTIVTIQLAIQVTIGIVALFFLAGLLDISFGPLGLATLKLAAIIAFPAAISLFVPGAGWLVALMLYFILIWWLFQLEGREVLISAVIIWVFRFVGTVIAGIMF